MVNKILTASGLPYKEARFPDPPRETHAIYFDGVTREKPDPVPRTGTEGVPCILTHDIMVELYAPVIDPAAASALEAAIDAEGLEYTSQGWYWLSNIQRYQNIYEFTYTEKRRA